MPDKEHKTMKKMITKKPIKSRRIADRVLKATPVRKKTLKKITGKKAIKKSKKNIKSKKIKKVEKKQTIAPPVPGTRIIPIIPPIPTTPSVPEVQIVPSVPHVHFLPAAPKTNLLTILFFLSILLFFLGGYFYPATSEDIVSNNVLWAGNDGKYDRGLFSQFYASIAFTFGVILLGYYVNATFIRYNIKYWNYFLIGILLMFFFGLGKIGELVFNHKIFEGFKNLILPVALIILAFASYKIHKNMVGGI